LKSGEIVGERFEIEELAGAGAMGLVYRARDRASNETVAVKVLREGAKGERFDREARLLADLHHPGIVRYVAHGASIEGPYLAMEWLDGCSLSERLETAELTLAETLAVIEQIAAAIGAAHRRLVIHRDLKPSNVFLIGGSTSRVKVVDFGIARQGAFASELTRTGAIVGSPRYMSPEQAAGKRELEPASDVWALGVIAFRCLTGRLPFAGESVELVLTEILLAQPPPVRELAPQVPEELAELVAAMMARDPAQRLADGEQVRAALASVVLEPALSLHAPERQGLTREEQRFTCVIAVRTEAGSELLHSVVAPFGASVLWAEPRLALVVLRERGSTGDLTLGAARCALAIADRISGASVGLVMGAGAVADPTGSDRTLSWRAEQLLSGPAGGVHLDETAAGLLAARFEIGGEAGLRRLLRERPDAIPARRLLGRVTPCVGRQRELGALQALWDECVSESVARVALVTGAAGVGKSRVRHELLRSLEGGGHEVWLGRGDPTAPGAPFGILADALRPALGVRLGAPLALQRRGIAERVARHVPREQRARVERFLSELVGVAGSPEDDELSLARSDPTLMGDQIRAAWEDFVDAQSAHAPVLLVLEDMQWGDWPTLKLVDAVLRQLSERPLLVIGIGRPELFDLFPGLWAERGVQGIPLGELPRRAAERLVREVLGPSVAAERVQAILERAMGNAFFLEELIRAAAERPEDDALPPSVLAMAQARVQALDPDARHVLRAASVFGHAFWRGSVEALLGGADGFPQLDEWLRVLVDLELITPRRSSQFPDEPELTFRHALIRDAAYSMLTEADRALGHRLAAEWLEPRAADALVVAEHQRLGGHPERAGHHLLRVAEQALEGDDFEAALEHADGALASGLDADARGRAHFIRATALHWKADLGAAESASASAMQHLPPRSSSWYVAAALGARIASRLGHQERLEALVEELAADDRPETAPDRAIVLSMIGVPAVRAARHELAARVFEMVARLEPELSDDPSSRLALARGWLERLHGYRALVQGDSAAYLRRTQAAVELFERGGDRRNAITFLTSVGFALITLGLHADAERVLVEALAGGKRLGLGMAQSVAKHNLGYAVALQGRLERGIALEREAQRAAAEHGDRWTECAAWSYLSQLLLLAGRAAEAEAAAESGLALAAAGARPLTLALLARARLAQGELSAALAAVGESRADLDQVGTLEDGDALTRLIHVEVLQAAGQSAEAARILADAGARLQARAAKISDPELRESFLCNVPEHAATLLSLARSQPPPLS
jgi:eukaryotic-like serine/threonine-protein kinase